MQNRILRRVRCERVGGPAFRARNNGGGEGLERRHRRGVEMEKVGNDEKKNGCESQTFFFLKLQTPRPPPPPPPPPPPRPPASQLSTR